MKACTKCGEEKRLDEFGRDRRRPDGRRSWCKTCHNEYRATYRARNKERITEQRAAYYQENKERGAETVAAWRQANRPAAREIARRRRARKRGATGSHSLDEWLSLLEKTGNRCLACGNTEDLTRDHVKPLAMGGSDNISNIQPLCASCNSAKGATEEDYR